MVKGLIPHLEAVVSTYLQDLSPKGIIGLCHSHIIVVLLGLVPGLLGLFQFHLEGHDLLLGGRQLVLDLAKLPSLTFSLPFGPFQGDFNTFFVSVYLGQLCIQLLELFLCHLKSLHSYNMPSFFILHHFMGAIYYFLDFVRSLDSLSRKKKKIRVLEKE